jgi:hypothetical protein
MLQYVFRLVFELIHQVERKREDGKAKARENERKRTKTQAHTMCDTHTKPSALELGSRAYQSLAEISGSAVLFLEIGCP